MYVYTLLGQGLSAQLLVEEGNGKPPHHHPSSHFPSLDDTGVSPLSVITDLPYGRALIITSHNTRSSDSPNFLSVSKIYSEQGRRSSFTQLPLSGTPYLFVLLCLFHPFCLG